MTGHVCREVKGQLGRVGSRFIYLFILLFLDKVFL